MTELNADDSVPGGPDDDDEEREPWPECKTAGVKDYGESRASAAAVI